MKTYAVLGHSVTHSLSPEIHHTFARQLNITLCYKAISTQSSGFFEQLTTFQQQGGVGCNITAPFKPQAYQFSKSSSAIARVSQAVNTLKLLPDGSWFGDNTDGIGLLRDLTLNKKINIQNKIIIILGAGGAARGIIPSLLSYKPARIIIANRTTTKATALAREFSTLGPISAVSINQLNSLNIDLFINTTSVALKPILDNAFNAVNTIFYDVNYGELAKQTMQHVIKLGFKHCYDGIGMLVEQAAESFYIWHGIRPKTDAIINTMQNRNH